MNCQEVIDLTADASAVYRMELPGEPPALPRPRSSWQSNLRHYNPATKKLKLFKQAVLAAIPETGLGYIYPNGVPVTVTIICYMKRPNSDFTNNQRGLGRLKSIIPLARPYVPDIDNLAKFVLDGLNRLVYEDDRQVVKLVACKLQDNDGECQGRTLITISAFDAQRDLHLVV
jgi:Holliday junction resolvase RusA-like endonuclease